MPEWIRQAALGLVLCGILGGAQAADPVAASSGSYALPVGLAPAASVPSATPQPDPVTQADGTLALPTLNQAVIDQAGLLSAVERQSLEQQLRSIHEAGRAQIGLIIVPSTGIEPIFDYATRAFAQWQLGDDQRDNGLLIVLARNDRKIQILTGYGLEGVLPDVIVKRIISEQMTPRFKQGDYAGGLNAGITRIDQILQQDPETAKAAADQARQQSAQANQSQGLPSGVMILVVMLVLGSLATLMLGRFLGSMGAGVAGAVWALSSGVGLIGSVLLGGLLFFLLLTGILPLFLRNATWGGGGGGFGGGGFGGSGGGYSGGGGSFGGGGASGSW